MDFKKIWVGIVIVVLALFGMASVSSAEDNSIIDIDFTTDKEAYESTDEITSTITITNSSNRYYAEELDIRTSLPDELEVMDQDMKVDDGQVIWDVDSLERGESTELTIKTKLKENMEESSNQVAGEKTDSSDNSAGTNTSSSNDELTAPQTGDYSSIVKYIVILVVSVVAGVLAFIFMRKKKLLKYLTFLLPILIIFSSVSVAHAEESNVQTFTETHQLTIGEQSYNLETTITATIQDGQVEVPVTGTAFDSNGNLMENDELTFTAKIEDELVEEVVQTDDEGYFVVRLVENVTYDVKGNGLEAQLKANDLNEMELTNQEGEIQLGKKLVNGDNRSSLQPSAIYLSDEEASKITEISSDLSQATLSESVDIQADDLIVVPEWEDYPAGIAFQVTSVQVTDGTVTLNLTQPELEDIFKEIIGDLEADMTSDNFVPAEGVSIAEDPTAGLEHFSPRYTSITDQAMSLGGKVTLNLGDLYKNEEFSLKGSVDLSGQVTGDIDWRLGLNPVEEFDFNFQGEQRVNAEVATSVTKKKEVPLGKFIAPTQIPGLAVSVPFDLVTSVNGKVSVKISYGMRENIGLAYERGSGMRTYPEENFEPFFNTSDINGSGGVSAGVRMSVLAQALGIDLAGAAATGSVSGNATTSILGPEGLFQCITLAGSFDGKLNLRAPVFDWESSGSIDFSKVFASKKFGNCVSSININPSELEMSPGETTSVNVTARDNIQQAPINNDDKLRFDVSDDTIRVEKNPTRVDIVASESAQDGDVIEVKGIYDTGDSEITDTLTVKIVDEREKGKLVGKVVDAVEDTPLSEATVKVYRDDREVSSVHTAEDGTYETNLTPGMYKVEVSHTGYVTDSSQVEITSSDTTTYDSELQLVGDEYAGTGTVAGQIVNALTGNGVAELTIEIRKGKNNTTGEVVETLTTNDNGGYEVELPGGNYTMALNKEGYIPAQANILSIGGEVRGNQNGTISPDGVIDENLRIVLTWGESPRDLDSHLTGPKIDGGRFHIYYSDKVYRDDGNDVNLDRDDVSSYGPETVTVINKMQMGTYTYAIHNYTGRYLNENNQLDLSNSDARVQIYREDTLLATFNVPVDQVGNSWRVFEIRDGEIVPINTIETISSWGSADSFAPVGE
ncbi:carboxypeptidase regulatory-like domain-containing protein [Oceanobacillus halophilus]|uniref:Uncharacterized protein n=1 Tax=Oceanobacillus halophilus TaxID=930130 RepID=A0A494ZSE0_9BACI|nr:carboxypeptidase regulatory-like domain-containing protein [Oceanobacillus halophilus]RKQ28560.1 hypothetical protein D8M06_18780 [Oceanobacillus halophilus]